MTMTDIKKDSLLGMIIAGSELKLSRVVGVEQGEDGVIRYLLSSPVKRSGPRAANPLGILDEVGRQEYELEEKVPDSVLLDSSRWTMAPSMSALRSALDSIEHKRSSIHVPTSLPPRSWEVRADKVRDLDFWVMTSELEVDRELAMVSTRLQEIIDHQVGIFLLLAFRETNNSLKARLEALIARAGQDAYRELIFPASTQTSQAAAVQCLALLARIENTYRSSGSVSLSISRVLKAAESRLELHREATDQLLQSMSDRRY